VVVGPLTAATPTSPDRPAIASATLDSSRKIATISPSSGSCCISLPRATTTRSASATSSTPAMTAATYSPAL
jgi:hypothetical protein